ncbi:hypothetical protein [Shewanella algae]|uniref:hypothetical protein n=1 Tax=Shewanella TaxID=22 RepID=UPI0031F5B2B9
MFDPDMPEPHVIESLTGFVDEAEKAIESAKELGYMGVSIGLSLEAALNLVEAAKRYQEPEPTCLGFPKYPESEKLKAVSEQSQAIGEFIEWLQLEKKIVFGTWEGNSVNPVNASIESLLAAYFRIDLKQVEIERKLMLQQL